MAKGEKALGILTVVAGAVAGIAKVVSVLAAHRHTDLGCDWTCDNCGDSLNEQRGFSAGTAWTCHKCGYSNDVSEKNVIHPKLVEDEYGRSMEVIDFPAPGDWEDPEDY